MANKFLKDGEYGGENPKTAKAVRKMNLFSDILMTRVFLNPECTQVLLSVILGRKDLKVKETRTQHNITNLYGRSISLDIFATDKKGIPYNIEVQNLNAGAIPKRARYHSSLIDANVSDVGKDFKKLPETYVIFITKNDYWGDGEPLYEIERTIKKSGKPFNDGVHIIYVNGKNKSDTELGRLMQDFLCKEPEHFHNEVLAEAVRHYKYTEEGLHDMCKIVEDLVKDERKEIALKLIAKGNLSFEEISDLTKLSLKEVKALAEGKSA